MMWRSAVRAGKGETQSEKEKQTENKSEAFSRLAKQKII